MFLGFLKGVNFFWTTTAMFLPMLFMVICLLIIFFALDTYFYNREEALPIQEVYEPIRLKGSFNLILLGGVIGGVLLSGFWKPHIQFDIYYVHLELQNVVRDFILLGLTIVSLKLTPNQIRKANEYTSFPIIEVAKLFAGIFVTIIPAIAILKIWN